jgi:hypothetical protein
MSRVDDRIRDEMDRLTRPVPLNGVFEAVSGKKTRHRVARRVQGAALAVAVVAGSVAGGVGLVRLFDREGAPSQGPTSPSPVQSSPGGAGVEQFPVICDESFLRADTDGDGNLDEVAVFSPGKTEACDSPEVGQHYVIHVSGNKDTVPGVPEPEVLYGIDQDLPACTQPFACRLYAAPDLDGDGADELAVQVAKVGSTRSILFYRLGVERSSDPAGADRYSLRLMVVAAPGDPEHGFLVTQATFPLNSAESPFKAVACLGDQHNPRVVASTAVLTDPAKELYDVHYTIFRPAGNALEVLRTEDHHDVGWGELLPLQEPNLCGAPLVAGAS